MRAQHHLSKSTLLDYAAGRLAAALSVAASSHLAWCRECRQAAETAAKTRDRPDHASHAALPVDPAWRGQTALKARGRSPAATEFAASEVSDFGLPMPLAQCLDGRGLDDLAWRKVLPGVAVCNLALPPGAPGQFPGHFPDQFAGRLRLVRMLPGKALPSHGHGGCELSFVLRGAYRDQFGRYAIGDIADIDGASHRPVAEAGEPCICLVAAETPARYRSWCARLWQRLIGL